MQTKFRFNKKTLDQLPAPEKRQRFRDTGVEGLIMEMTPKGVMTFRVYKKIKGEAVPISVTLGKYPAMSIENARKQALETLDKLSSGVNPNDERREKVLANVTLREVYEDYKKSRELRPSTLRGYDQVLKNLSRYVDQPLNKIDEDVIKKLHQDITNRSRAQADLTMRFIRALFNFAKYEYRGINNRSLFEHNPVGILSHTKRWNNLGRKQTRISKAQLADWFDGLESVRQSGTPFAVSVCDLAEMALLTGLRRSELIDLQWSQVDLKEKTYYISTTKNGDRLELPISNHLSKLLKARQKLRDEKGYVFNAENQHGNIREPKKVLAQVVEQSEVDFTLHDLRRTFTTVAEALNVGTYTLKRLLNHRTRRDDVTAGYTILTPEELREPAQKIEDAILQQAGIAQPKASIDTKLESLLVGLSESQKRELIFKLSEQKEGIRSERD